jgi:hypothetical protein
LIYFRFTIEDLADDGVLLVNMDVSVCLERAGPCEVILHVLQDARLPKPFCNWNTDFIVKGSTSNK